MQTLNVITFLFKRREYEDDITGASCASKWDCLCLDLKAFPAPPPLLFETELQYPWNSDFFFSLKLKFLCLVVAKTIFLSVDLAI